MIGAEVGVDHRLDHIGWDPQSLKGSRHRTHRCPDLVRCVLLITSVAFLMTVSTR